MHFLIIFNKNLINNDFNYYIYIFLLKNNLYICIYINKISKFLIKKL